MASGLPRCRWSDEDTAVGVPIVRGTFWHLHGRAITSFWYQAGLSKHGHTKKGRIKETDVSRSDKLIGLFMTSSLLAWKKRYLATARYCLNNANFFCRRTISPADFCYYVWLRDLLVWAGRSHLPGLGMVWDLSARCTTLQGRCFCLKERDQMSEQINLYVCAVPMLTRWKHYKLCRIFIILKNNETLQHIQSQRFFPFTMSCMHDNANIA